MLLKIQQFIELCFDYIGFLILSAFSMILGEDLLDEDREDIILGGVDFES